MPRIAPLTAAEATEAKQAAVAVAAQVWSDAARAAQIAAPEGRNSCLLLASAEQAAKETSKEVTGTFAGAAARARAATAEQATEDIPDAAAPPAGSAEAVEFDSFCLFSSMLPMKAITIGAMIGMIFWMMLGSIPPACRDLLLDLLGVRAEHIAGDLGAVLGIDVRSRSRSFVPRCA